MKINTISLVTVLSFFVFLSSSTTTARDIAQDILADTASPNKVLIVHTILKDVNGLQKPVINQMVIQKGHSRLLQKEALQKKDSSLYQIEVLDTSNQPIFRMNFQFPRVMTVPIINPASKQKTANDVQPQIQIESPEASLVVPYFPNASIVRILQPGRKELAVSMHIQEASVLDIIHSENKTTPPPSQLGKFHILIMASGYSPSEMTAFNNRAQSVKDQLLSIGPFISKSSNIEIHTYANTSDLGCYSGCSSIDRLMCCDNFSITSAAAASGEYFDEIIIIHNTGTYSGGGYRDYGTYETNSYNSYCMIYDGEFSEAMAIHEFGHSFGDLCDEYSYGDEGYAYYDCANCRESCDEWTGLISTCNQGCDARSSYFRPDDSVMLTLSIETYNDVSIQNSLIPRISYFISNDSESPVADIEANGPDFINSGATSTSSTSVTLSISATDDTGVTGYYASESSITPSSSGSGWTSVSSTTSYSSDVGYTLSSGSGTKTVYVWFKDGAGNVSDSISDSIGLSTGDTNAPTNSTASEFINSGASSTSSTSVTLSISATDDTGVTGYYASESSITPSSSGSGWTSVSSTTSYSSDVGYILSSGDGAKTVYVWFKDDAGNVSDSASGPIELSINPVPDIKANGTDGPLTITQGDSLVVTVSLDTGSLAGANCDWWVAESTPNGWYYYSLSTSWTPAGSSYTGLSPTYQGVLFDLDSYSVLNTSGLSEGAYTFYFAIDTNADGSLDFDQLYYDSVSVSVTSD